MVNFRKNSLKKLDTFFSKWLFKFFSNGWCICLLEQKGQKLCKTILQKKLELGDVYKLRKNVFSQPLPCKKVAVKFVKKKLKMYEDSYFSFF